MSVAVTGANGEDGYGHRFRTRMEQLKLFQRDALQRGRTNKKGRK